MTDLHFADAIALLKADHRHLDDLIGEFARSRWPMRRQSVADQLCTLLSIHLTLEEEIFFPALRGRVAEDMLETLRVQDDGTRSLIRQIEAMNPRDEAYGLKVKALVDKIRRHILLREGFVHGLFACCRRAGVDLVTLRDAMNERRRILLSQGGFAARSHGAVAM
ncbi:MAG: hemerythrin domain-containing protein [Sphingomonadales bacterium]|nr:hemerythrin domain-containing protein [Sphingomonadales bacterium]MDE2170421.1 hemerythrin domain-containing protein [Sphingomonadales bacterium]